MVDRVGQHIGNYRVVRLLGQGGFADVYLGEHIHLNTKAAIKILHTRLTNNDIALFRQEARAVAHLEHPHIVRVFDFGVEGATPYLIMSYASNGTLRQRHPKGTQLPLSLVVSYVNQIAAALQYAHDRKLIHRDIKPENLLAGHNDEVLLSDFGIAVVGQSSSYQSTKDMAGTIAYMAPEQIEAHPRPASDQYSLGIVVYEWLTGDRPFHGTFTEIAIKHRIVPPPPLREKLPNISPSVEQVVMRALAKDPKDRFPSVHALAAALEQSSQVGQSSSSELADLAQLPNQMSQPMEADKRSSRPMPPMKTLLLIGLVLAFIFSAIIGVVAYQSHANQVNTNNPVPATTAKTNATATAIVVTSQSRATATFTAKNANPYPPAHGTLALSDPLRDNSEGYGWEEYAINSYGAACQFRSDGYHVSERQNYYHPCHASVQFSNFTFEVQMKIITGNCGGVAFRDTTTEAHAYSFVVCQDGSYELDRFDGFAPPKAILSQSSSAIHIGLNQTNLIAVVVNRCSIDLYVNMQHINNTSDCTYNRGEIGVIADPSTEAIYSNAKVWTL